MPQDGRVPIGWPGFGLFRSRPLELLGMFQSRDQAKQAAESLGDEGYEVRFGRIEKGSGAFITPDLDRQR